MPAGYLILFNLALRILPIIYIRSYVQGRRKWPKRKNEDMRTGSHNVFRIDDKFKNHLIYMDLHWSLLMNDLLVILLNMND